MAEYIERESVHELIERLEKYQMFNYDRSQSIVGISPDDVNFGVDKIPSADVAPVRHGRWELDKYGGVICSECKACCSIGGKTAIHNAKSSQHFCFNCGVKMD